MLEYAAIPSSARRDTPITLIRDQIMGAANESTTAFYKPLDLAVDAVGRVYVYDAGNVRVQVFDRWGEYLHSIGGREGQGPGDLASSGTIAIAGERLVFLGDWGFLSVWTLDGNHEETHWFQGARPLWALAGSNGDDLVGGYSATFEDDEYFQAIGRISLQGRETRRYAILPDPGEVTLQRVTPERHTSIFTGLRREEPTFALSRDSELYFTAGSEYEVLAVELNGRARWALRVPWPREPLRDEDMARALESVRKHFPDASSSEIEWPVSMPALAGRASNWFGRKSVRVDGHGHLYVFPFTHDQADGELQPVDVYSRDGIRLYAGMITNRPWYASWEDFVYSFEVDVDTDEEVAVRYRLVEPF